MAAALDLAPPAPSIPTKNIASDTHSCPSCGTGIDMADVGEAKRRIAELEAQMERLKEKATAAVDKCADYEDQIRSLRTAQFKPSRSNISDTYSMSDDPPRPATANSTKQSRFSFLTSRFPSPSTTGATAPPPPPAKDILTTPNNPPIDLSLLNELERERALRAKAEERCQKVDSEIEELSVQLFSQANEMVAEERRARAKLEERVETLERRDREKMGRLDRLEKAVSRVERVKALLGEAGKVESKGLAPPSARR